MRRTLLLLTVLLAVGASKSSAIVDSMYANNSVGIPAGNHPEYAYGAPDHQEALISSSSQEFFIRFDRNGSPVNFAPGSTIHIYWTQQATDSEAAVLSLVHVTKDWINSTPDSVMIVDQPGMITITIPKAGYNAIHFRLTGEIGSSNPGSTSFYVDAATLIQDNLAVATDVSPKIVFSMYPNPAQVQTGIGLNIPQEYVGRGEIVIADVLGSEVKRLQLSDASMHVEIPYRGTYIAMLMVDGLPVGRGYKFSVE